MGDHLVADRDGQRRTAARIGLLERVVGTRRAQAPQAETPRPPAAAGPQPVASSASPDRLTALEDRVGHLEAELEALQDAVHRTATRDDERFDDVDRRLDPAHITRALSDDARRRGI